MYNHKQIEIMEVKREKRHRVIVALLCALFILVAYAVTNGQVQRYTYIEDGKEFVAKTPAYPLKFKPMGSDKDTIYLSIIADSIDKNISSIRLHCYYSPNQTPPNKPIVVRYQDGYYDRFIPFRGSVEDRIIEFNIEGRSFQRMKETAIASIEFTEVLYCDKLRKPNYFMDFLTDYRK